MKDTSIIRSADKEIPAIPVTSSEFIGLQDKTIEEKRLKLALYLRRF